jgi:hypothetical protein
VFRFICNYGIGKEENPLLRLQENGPQQQIRATMETRDPFRLDSHLWTHGQVGSANKVTRLGHHREYVDNIRLLLLF